MVKCIGERLLNVRQQLYKKNRLLGMSQYNAARAAGYSHNTAHNAGVNIEKHCDIVQALERAGLTDKALADHAVNGVNANKVISANITYGEADEKTNDFIEVPDWNARHKYYDTILKLQRKLSDKLIDQSIHTHYKEVKIVIDRNTDISRSRDTGASSRIEKQV